MSKVSAAVSKGLIARTIIPLTLLIFPALTFAAEGGLGRPIAGSAVLSNIGLVPPEPVTIVSLQEIYLNGNIGGSRGVPVAGQTSLGIDAELSLTLATIMQVWDTGTGSWNFASAVTLPYMWSSTDAAIQTNRRTVGRSDDASDLYDLYVSPIIAGYHFSQTSHIALSFNFWAPTGAYDKNNLSNPSLNTWTFIPQVAYTQMFPDQGLQLDAVSSVEFYTKNRDTDYHNAPLFTLDVMGRKMFNNGIGAGVIVGTVQQLGSDKGSTADQLNGFKGHDLSVGPVITYDTKFSNGSLLSLGMRWIPTVSSSNRIDSDNTVTATAAFIF